MQDDSGRCIGDIQAQTKEFPLYVWKGYGERFTEAIDLVNDGRTAMLVIGHVLPIAFFAPVRSGLQAGGMRGGCIICWPVAGDAISVSESIPLLRRHMVLRSLQVPDGINPLLQAGDVPLAEEVFLCRAPRDDAHGVDELYRVNLGKHFFMQCRCYIEWLQQGFPAVCYSPMLEIDDVRQSLEEGHGRARMKKTTFMAFPVAAMQVFGDEKSALLEPWEKIAECIDDIAAGMRAIVYDNVKAGRYGEDAPKGLGFFYVADDKVNFFRVIGKAFAVLVDVAANQMLCIGEVFFPYLQGSTVLDANLQEGYGGFRDFSE